MHGLLELGVKPGLAALSEKIALSSLNILVIEISFSLRSSSELKKKRPNLVKKVGRKKRQSHPRNLWDLPLLQAVRRLHVISERT